ncbi:acyl-CoA dehydrogenase [Brevundimonas staleyi]|uniref:Acyl-CoA dehydrogenase n=1 Tax=Brevundimonas staleyi TaxID=74326 RepID=A0ABW0FRC6_9CAUL
MSAYALNRRDLDFLVFDWLRIEDLLDRPRFADHSRETLSSMLDLSETLARDLFQPAYKKSDQVEPWMDADGVHVIPEIAAAVHEHAASGLMAGAFDHDLGGLQAPLTAATASVACLMGANLSAAGFGMLTMANARLIATFGTPTQVQTFAAPQLTGEATGTMCLSEPQAGSSLADITTLADADGEDALGRRFRLRGTKMWISGADHDVTGNIVHLVLAKTPGPDGRPLPGVKGISLFIVPKTLPDGERNDAVVTGLNHKMGYRGIPNCVVAFGDGFAKPEGRPGAVGYLVGEVGQGLAQMFQMMNEARINVGLGAAMMAYRGYRQSLGYAQERLQGRAGGSATPTPIADHPDVRFMLMTQKTYAEGALALTLYCARLLDEEQTGPTPESARRLLDLLTPIAKTWPSEQGLIANDLAIQIHGGYGYTRDFDVEQVYRDNRLNPIHEGTTGIQAIDLLGRKLARDEGALADLLTRIAATSAKARTGDLADCADALDQVWSRLSDHARSIASPLSPQALFGATQALRAWGHGVVAWLWLDLALTASEGPQDDFNEGKRAACRFFFTYELPRIGLWLDAAGAGDTTTLTLPMEAF